MRCRAGARAREERAGGRGEREGRWSVSPKGDSLCLSSDSEWSIVHFVDKSSQTFEVGDP